VHAPLTNDAMQRGLRIEVFHTVADLRPFEPGLRELNANARRPSPFHTPELLRAACAHDEHAVLGGRPLLLVAFEGQRPIGFLPLRIRPERVLGFSRHTIELLMHDGDRLSVISRPEDEVRCATDFLHYLLERERAWSCLRLGEQDSDSPFVAAAPMMESNGFFVRRMPSAPHATVMLESGFETWWEPLAEVRRSVLRQTNALMGAGRLELVCCDQRNGGPAQFELFLELEARSARHAAKSGLMRHPMRVELLRALTHEHTWAPSFHWLLLDGLPIAGMFSLRFQKAAWLLELTSDMAFDRWSPREVLFPLVARDLALHGARAFQLRTHGEPRWQPKLRETFTLEMDRRLSIHGLWAIASEARRMVGKNQPEPAPAPIVEEPRGAELARQLRARTHALETFGRLPVDRLDGKSIADALQLRSDPPAQRAAGGA
jgi:hypothetical protein